MKVLVVDNQELNVNILYEWLNHVGMSVITALSGESALQVLHAEQQSGDPVQLAIIDYSMPVMNGLQLADIIREKYDKKTLSLILFSSAAQEGGAKMAKLHGFNGYLPEPINRAALIQTIAAALSPKDDESDAFY